MISTALLLVELASGPVQAADLSLTDAETALDDLYGDLMAAQELADAGEERQASIARHAALAELTTLADDLASASDPDAMRLRRQALTLAGRERCEAGSVAAGRADLTSAFMLAESDESRDRVGAYLEVCHGPDSLRDEQLSAIAARDRVEDLHGQLAAADAHDAAGRPVEATRLRQAALDELTALGAELAGRNDPGASAAAVQALTLSGREKCERGAAPEGRRQLERAAELALSDARKARIEGYLDACDRELRATDRYVDERTAPATTEWDIYEDEATGSASKDRWEEDYEWGATPTRSSLPAAPRRTGPGPGRPAIVGGSLLAAAGFVAVSGTWHVYQTNPVMSETAWTGLQIGNTAGWIAVAGGGAFVLGGTVQNLSLPPLGAGMWRRRR